MLGINRSHQFLAKKVFQGAVGPLHYRVGSFDRLATVNHLLESELWKKTS